MRDIQDIKSGKERLRDIRDNLKQPWLLALLCVSGIPLFPEYIAPLLAGGALLAAYFDARERQRRVMVGTLGKWILVYIAYMAFGLLYTPHFLSTLSTAAMWAVMFLAYLAVTTVLTDRSRFDTALFCISLVAGLAGLIGCLQYGLRAFLGLDISLQFWRFIDQVVFEWLPLKLLPITTDLRVSSTFNNPNIFAEYLVIGADMVFPIPDRMSYEVASLSEPLEAGLGMLPFFSGIMTVPALARRGVKKRSMLLALVCSSAIGIVFGFMPARNASRLNPIDALSRE